MSSKEFKIVKKKEGVFGEITKELKYETVESFLARGGQVNKCNEGSSGKYKRKSAGLSVDDLLTKCTSEEQRDKIRKLFGGK